MRIGLFLVTNPKRHPAISRLSAGFFQERATRLPQEMAIELPSRVDLDPGFPPVPLGSAEAEKLDLTSLDPMRSERFLIHAFVEAETAAQVPMTIEGMTVYSDPRVALFTDCPGFGPRGSASDVALNLGVTTLKNCGLDGDSVGVVIMDSGIALSYLSTRLSFSPRLDIANSWTNPANPVLPGQHQKFHGTMCAFDALIAAPRATLLDYPAFADGNLGEDNPNPVAHTLQGPTQALAVLLQRWLSAAAGSGIRVYKALVVNNSWGIFNKAWDLFPAGDPRRYIDNPRHPFNQQTAALAQSGVDVIYAAGDCGDLCPNRQCEGETQRTIMGANALPQVLTVAACDKNGARLTYSSQGPGIAGMCAGKPDLTAYAHFDGSRALGDQEPDPGTSAACAVASGCVAALRTKAPSAQISPGRLFDILRSSARIVNGSGPGNPDYGYGIINPVAAGARATL